MYFLLKTDYFLKVFVVKCNYQWYIKTFPKIVSNNTYSSKLCIDTYITVGRNFQLKCKDFNISKKPNRKNLTILIRQTKSKMNESSHALRLRASFSLQFPEPNQS